MLEIIITSSLLILIVIAVRFFLRHKLSPVITYALWAVVALRLLMPVSIFDTPLSVMNLFDNIHTAERTEEVPEYQFHTDGDYVPDTHNIADTSDGGQSEVSDVQPELPMSPESDSDNNSVSNTGTSAHTILLIVWLAGSIAVLAYSAVRNVRFYRTLRKARKPAEGLTAAIPVYVVDCIDSPCLFGVFRPAIYLTDFAADDSQRSAYVIEHELSHYRHRDNIWAIVRVVCCAMYWFNPLVWLAAYLSRQDSELACDSAVIKKIGSDHRFDYGRTLLDMVNVRYSPAAVILTSTTMSSGAKSIRERISTIRLNPKTVIWAAAAAGVVIILAVLLTFTGAAGGEADISDLSESEMEAPAYTVELPCQIECCLYEKGNADAVDYVEVNTVADIEYVIGTLSTAEQNSASPKDVPSESWVAAELVVDFHTYYRISNDGYIIRYYTGSKVAFSEPITIETDNIAAGSYFKDYYDVYRLPKEQAQQFIERLSAICDEHRILIPEGVGVIESPLTVTAMLFDNYSLETGTPDDVVTFESSEEFHSIVYSLRSQEWEEIDAEDIPKDSTLALCLSLDNYEYYYITADGYVIWKYLGSKANNAPVVSIETQHDGIPLAGDYPNGYYGFYKMSKGTFETLMVYIDIAKGQGKEGLEEVQQRVKDLIESGTCMVYYLDVSPMIDNGNKIDCVLQSICAYGISSLEPFDTATLPEDAFVYENCTFVQTNDSAPTADVTVSVSMTQYASWMTVEYGENTVTLGITNTSALWYLFHEYIPEWSMTERDYTYGDGYIDMLFADTIVVESDYYNCSGAAAYGSDAFTQIWSAFGDIAQWELSAEQSELDRTDGRIMTIHCNVPYSPPDCLMKIYAESGYIYVTFKSEAGTWYYVPGGLDERCREIAALVG